MAAKAELTFLHDAVFAGRNRAIRADKHAGKAADAFVVVDADHAVFPGERAGDAAFYTNWVVTMSA